MLTAPFDMFGKADQTCLQLADRDTLFREGEATSGLYLCVDASVRLSRVGPEGESITIHHAMPGESFAEASVFADRYHCDASATRAGKVVKIARTAILDALRNPEFALAYTRLLSKQVQNYRLRVEILSIKSAQDRVMAAIVAGMLDGPVVDFAAKIALTPEATFRALRQLVNSGQLGHPSRGNYRLITDPRR